MYCKISSIYDIKGLFSVRLFTSQLHIMDTMQRIAIQKYFLDNLDTVACISGIVSGILITSLYVVSKTIHLLMLGLALTFASLVYLIIKNRKELSCISIRSSIKKIFEILFFFLFSISLLVLFVNEGRPFLYFVFISLCSGFLALSILNIKSNFDTAVQIVKIFLVSFNIKYSIFLFYGGSGVDYWTHLKMNSILSQKGLIDMLIDKEQFFPLMHIQTAVYQMITITPIKEATNFAIILPLVISSICIFLVARKIFNEKIGLLAMLIMNITDYHTCWGSTPQTTTFGICIFFFIIFIIFQMAISNQNRIIWPVIMIIFFLSLILTHAVSSFILLITITGFFAGSYLFKKIFGVYTAVFPPILFLFLYGIILLQHWLIAIYNEMRGQPFFNVIVSTLDYYITEHADFLNRPESFVQYTTTLPPLIEQVENTAGLTLLMFLAAIGSFFWLSRKYRNQFTFSMLTCTVFLLVITFGFPLFGIRNIMPGRWFVFMYFFLSIMAAYAVYISLTIIPKQRLRTVISVFIIFCLTFFMTTSTISNLDSPLWLKESTTSTSYTVQELKGAETLSHYSDAVFSDSGYEGTVLNYYYRIQTIPIYSRYLPRNTGNIFVWRKYTIDRPIQTLINIEGYYKPVISTVILDPTYHKTLEKMQKIYETDDVQGYYFI